jgi:hypothetical protein
MNKTKKTRAVAAVAAAADPQALRVLGKERTVRSLTP